MSASLSFYVQISPSKTALAGTFLTCIQKVPGLSLCWDTAIPKVYHDSPQSFQANSVTVPELARDLMKSSLAESCVRWFKYKFWGLIPSQDSDMTCAQSSLFPCLHEAGLILVHKRMRLGGCYETAFLRVCNWGQSGCLMMEMELFSEMLVYLNCLMELSASESFVGFCHHASFKLVVCGQIIQHPFQFVSH